jgi:hypothetical protein
VEYAFTELGDTLDGPVGAVELLVKMISAIPIARVASFKSLAVQM